MPQYSKRKKRHAALIDLKNGTESEVVIMLHGMGRHNFNLHSFGEYLHQQGYRVILPEYPSEKKSIHACADTVADIIKNLDLKPHQKIHFVGQSMGGAVIRSLLERHPQPQNLGNVVMMVPPFGGSEVADWFKAHILFKHLYRWLKGPAGQEMGTENGGIHRLFNAAVNYPLGIIAARLPKDYKTKFKPFFMPGPEIIKGENDGLVSIENTKIDGMTDHVVVTSEHTSIEENQKAWTHALHFLRHARFKNQ